MKKIKVLIVSPFPPPFGGIARYAFDIFNSVELNDEFELHCFNTAKGEKYLHGEGRSERSWSRMWYFFKPNNIFFLIYLIFNYFEYFYKLITIRPDIVHVHTCSYFGFMRSGVFLLLSKPFTQRRIFHFHNAIDLFITESIHKPVIGSLVKFCISQANDYVVLSSGLGMWLENNIGIKPYVIWNACYSYKYVKQNNDWEIFIKKYPQAKDKIVVILVGGLYQHKGAFDLIKVVSDFSIEEREKLLFILPGKGEKNKAESLLREYKIEQFVLLPGVIEEEEKEVLVRNSDIFVLPSYAEGQPIAILEAMSASLPIISSRVGSIPEVVDEGVAGFLIDPGDCKALKNHILQLADNPDLRSMMGNAARKRVNDRHDIARLFESIGNMYRERKIL